MKISRILVSVIFLLLSCSSKLPPDNNWSIGKWTLIELKEVPVKQSGNTNKDAHLVFETAAKNYRGFGGCNPINGTYTINNGKIKFTAQVYQLAACPDMPFETTFLNALNEVDKYLVTGNTLVLKKGKTTLIKMQRK
ncbi:META domain-containing protein [Ferruginibacter sp.]|uniref:META domain-containing protein n=1 Tax=Ferruginibacter sp. TaxID=1940288 RepID=UPI00198E96B2|nr:META domain-containing protein [Ferruginibacter sp.]MBC7627369.1 META domain-containing protein [Ferruginibacter sp.]